MLKIIFYLYKAKSNKKFFFRNGFKDYRGDQVYSWLWEKSAINFEQMTNLPKSIRSILEDSFVINHVQINTIQKLDINR